MVTVSCGGGEGTGVDLSFSVPRFATGCARRVGGHHALVGRQGTRVDLFGLQFCHRVH